MLIATLLLSLAGAPEASPPRPLFTCTVKENTLEARNHSQQILVLSFASSDRAALLHLAIPAHATLSFHFPAHAITGFWLEVSSLSAGRYLSTGAMQLSCPNILNITAQDNTLEGPPHFGTLLPDSIAALVQLPTCAQALDVGVPPPCEDPVVDEVTDLRRRCRRPI